MDIYQLKNEHEKNNGFFFDPSWMRLYGDRMSNFIVAGTVVKIPDEGEMRTYYRVMRKRPNTRGRLGPEYFDTTTFEHFAG